jgi:hypothetical protein
MFKDWFTGTIGFLAKQCTIMVYLKEYYDKAGGGVDG